MRRTFALAAVLTLLAAMWTLPAGAQQSTTQGWNLGLHLGGSSLSVDDDRHGAGLGGIWVGYGFNPTVMVYVQADGGQFDVDDATVEGEWTMGHADLGVRFHFANPQRSWVPYLQVALSGRAVEVKDGLVNDVAQTDNINLTGGGLTLGGGIVFYFNQSLGMDLQLDWTGGTFTTIEVGSVSYNDLDVEAQSARFAVGLSWWP